MSELKGFYDFCHLIFSILHKDSLLGVNKIKGELFQTPFIWYV
jgi:hypothetical protein